MLKKENKTGLHLSRLIQKKKKKKPERESILQTNELLCCAISLKFYVLNNFILNENRMS